MNTFLETVFGQAKQNWLESIEASTPVDDVLFTKLERKHKFYRMPYFSGRRYFTLHEDQPRLMTGLTGITKEIQKYKGETDFLEKWKVDMAASGNDAERYSYMASEFGTLIHIFAAHLFRARANKEAFSVQGLDKEMMDYMRRIGIDGYYFKEWYTNCCKALLSLNSFYTEYEVDVLAIEFCVADFKWNICTPLDIICEMTVETGTGKNKTSSRNKWNLNIKGRKKPERNTHDKYQINAEMYIYNDYMDEKVERTGVLSPSWSWKTKPACNVHEFTGDFTQEEWIWYLKVLKNSPNGQYDKLFNPDLDAYIGDSNIFSVTEIGDVITPSKRTVSEYIKSFFK